jgi:restriction endonuclease S subunit
MQKSRLEGPTRLDAEYYQPEYLKIEDVLGKLKTTLLSDVCKITDGNHSKISDNFSVLGVRYLRGMDLSDFFISDSDPVYIPDEIYKTLKRSYIFRNDVLVSIVGTVGLISIVADEYEKLTGNCKIAILHPKNVDSWFLATFLACRFGQGQIKRKVAGAVQTGIILKDLASIAVPVVNGGKQKQVNELIQKAYENHTISKFLYSQAEDLLLKEFGIKGFEPEEELSYIVNLSDVKSVQRADAEYFQPKYKRLLEKIKAKKVKLLGELISIKKGFEPGSEVYQNEGKPFIRVSNISKHGIIDKDQKFLSDELYQKLKKDYEPKSGELLITKDATPGIAYVLEESIEGIIAGGILRLVLKNEIEGEYLALCINSMTGQMQIERDAGGSVIVHWKPEQVKKLQIPILPKPTQEKIADLVHQSHQARKKSKELLERAKREVEEFIEGK